LPEIVEYAKGDVFKVQFREGDTFGTFAVEHSNTVAWTMKDGDTIIGCAGYVKECDGVATFWGFFSEDTRGHGRTIIKYARHTLEQIGEFWELRRIQAAVRADRPEYRRFIEMLGFEYEGCLKKAAANGEDVLMYGRT